MKHIPSVLLAAALLCSCASSRYAVGFSAGQVGEMALFTPDSYVNYIDEKGMTVFHDSLSAVASSVLEEAVLESGVPVVKVLGTDFQEASSVKDFARMVIGQPSRRMSFLVPVPDAIDRRLEAEGMRYGLILVSDGMDRDVRGYRKDIAVGVALGIVTGVVSALLGGGGYSYSAPYRNSSSIWAIVVDAEEDRIVFYDDSPEREISPLKKSGVRAQVSTLLKAFVRK